MRCEIQSLRAPLLRTKGVLGIQSYNTKIGDKRTRTLSDTKRNRDRRTKSGGSERCKGTNHYGSHVQVSLYLAIVHSHCPSGLKGSFIHLLIYVIT